MTPKIYQTFWRRVGATIIDALVLLPLSAPFTLLFFFGMSYRVFAITSLLSPVVAMA